MASIKWISNSIDILSKVFSQQGEGSSYANLISSFKESLNKKKVTGDPKSLKIPVNESLEDCDFEITAQKKCLLGEELGYLSNKSKRVLVLEVNSHSRKQDPNSDVDILTYIPTNELAGKQVCSRCSFENKIRTLVNVCKFASISIKYPVEDGKSLEFTAFGVKTKQKDISGTFQNFLCLSVTKDKITAEYLIVQTPVHIGLIKLTAEKVQSSFNKQIQKTLYFLGNDILPVSAEAKKSSVCLVRIPFVFFKNKGVNVNIMTQCGKDIAKQFSVSYPAHGEFASVPAILKINTDKKAMENLIKSPSKSKKKIPTDLQEVKKEILVIVKNPSFAVGVFLCALGGIFIMVREYTAPRPKRVQRVPIL